MYNNTVSFTSLVTKIDHLVQGRFGISVFCMLGDLVHKILLLELVNKSDPGLSQIFVVGNQGTE
jgi:hypothetical protein